MKTFILILVATLVQAGTSFAAEAKSEACQQVVGKKFVLAEPSNSGLQSVEFRSSEEALTVTAYGVLGNWTCEQVENSDALGIHVNVQGWDTYITFSKGPYPHLKLNKGVGLSFEYVLESQPSPAQLLETKESVSTDYYVVCNDPSSDVSLGILRSNGEAVSPVVEQKADGDFKNGDMRLNCTYQSSGWYCAGHYNGPVKRDVKAEINIEKSAAQVEVKWYSNYSGIHTDTYNLNCQ